jgi:serine/threonine protein kinase
MELVEGHSLAERIEHGGRLSERRALSIFIPLCDALQHTSEKGVVHRDIKPANILLEHCDRPRLVDLGLARVEDDPMLTRTGATLGTPHYISPEQARDPVQPTRAATSGRSARRYTTPSAVARPSAARARRSCSRTCSTATCPTRAACGRSCRAVWRW